ncbi:MAG: hypothetical protein JSR82_14870 [Verrucomicrobia bacterium]|nr:hypothetical protein [Verrucomicrobiota bacterium]
MRLSPFLLLVTAGSLGAQSLTIRNFSFEIPVTPAGTFIAGPASPPTGWSVFGSTSITRAVGVLNPATTTLYTQPVPHGSNVAVVFLMSGGGPAGLEQTLTDVLALNTTYTLSLQIGNIANDPNPPHNSFDFTGFPGYRVELLAGGTLLAFDQNSVLPAEGAFLPTSFEFTTGPSHPQVGQPLQIRLINLNGAGIEVNFDDVQLVANAAVPEPGTIAAGVLAVALLGWRLRARRATSTVD